jgi:hypothetical protein
LNYLDDLPKVDGTLNAPTTEAWFVPWRARLEALGVELVEGRLLRIEETSGSVRCWVARGDERAKILDEETDYVVVATDLVTAERVTAGLPAVGVPGGLRGYATLVPPATGRAGAAIERDPTREIGIRPWDRLQTLSGIQYFFETSVSLFEGYLYFTDAPWALSAIGSHQLWRRRPDLRRDGYAGVLSVDVGAFRVPSGGPITGERSAWRCSRQEVADEVLRQIRAALPVGCRMPAPLWYHVDDHLVLGEDGVINNDAPYLIPIKGDWRNRPGSDPWKPTRGGPAIAPRPPLAPGVWQAPQGGYLVHWDRLVFAGVYVRTFTRMTTMEAANESARHAVNAILDHALARRGHGSPLGEHCRIWDPEEHEHPAFEPLKKLDETLFQLGLGHPLDVLGPASLASLRGLVPALDGEAPAGEPGGARTLYAALSRVRRAMDEDVRREGP